MQVQVQDVQRQRLGANGFDLHLLLQTESLLVAVLAPLNDRVYRDNDTQVLSRTRLFQ